MKKYNVYYVVNGSYKVRYVLVSADNEAGAEIKAKAYFQRKGLNAMITKFEQSTGYYAF